jgi:hypothetical protein
MAVRQSPMRKVRRVLADRTLAVRPKVGTGNVENESLCTMFYSSRHTFQYTSHFTHHAAPCLFPHTQSAFLARSENSAGLSDLSRQPRSLCSVEYEVIQRWPSLALYGASIIYVWS